MPKKYLTFDVFDRFTTKLSVPPTRFCSGLVVPSISLLDSNPKPSSVSVSDIDGSLITPWLSENACEKSNIVISYISSTRRPHSVDLDLADSFHINSQQIVVYVTKPYPGHDEETRDRIVIFSGSVCCPEERSVLFTLSAELRPSFDTHLLCSPDGHYVEISSGTGTVTLISPLTSLLLPISVCLDNVKFFTNKTTSPLTIVRPGLPGRPNLLILNPTTTNAINKFLLVPRTMDVSKPLLVPLSCYSKTTTTCSMTVANIFYGGVEIIGNPTIQHIILPDSLLTATERINNDILCTMLDCPVDEGSKRLITEQVIKKLSATVYSRLSGEPENKCLRKSLA